MLGTKKNRLEIADKSGHSADFDPVFGYLLGSISENPVLHSVFPHGIRIGDSDLRVIAIIVNQILFFDVTEALSVSEQIDPLDDICFSLCILSIKNIDLRIEGKRKGIDISIIFKCCAVKVHDINL